MTDSTTISSGALTAFRQALPQILVFTHEKFQLECTYAAEDHVRVHAAHIEQFNRDLAGLLNGVYAFDLFGNLSGEFVRLAGGLTAQGAGRSVIEAGLKAWIMAVQTLIKRPESTELTAPLIELLRQSGSLWSRAEVTPPPLEGHARVLHDLLLARSRKQAAEAFLDLLRNNITVEQAYQGALLPSLLNLQLKQRQGSLGAAQVQAAADICRYIMFRVLDSISSESRVPFSVLAACMPGEQDLLGSEIFANYLEVQGWSILFIRDPRAADEILQAAASCDPHIVVLSAASIQSLPTAVQLAADFKQTYPLARTALEGRAALLARERLGEDVDTIVSGFEKGHQSLLRLVHKQ